MQGQDHEERGRNRVVIAPARAPDHGPLSFIARVGEVLAGSLDDEQTHDRLLDLVVPTLADMCSIHVLSHGGQFQRIASRHHTPAMAAVSRYLGDSYLDEGERDGPIHQLLANGESLLWVAGSDGIFDLVIGPRQREAVQQYVELTSIMIVPLIAHGRPLGVLALSTAAPREPLSTADLRLAEDVARRAALALDSARLYREATAARLKAERAQQRLAFLAEASKMLAASLDDVATLQSVVKLAAPTLADWCGVTMVREDGSYHRTAVAHSDPRLQQLMQQHAPELSLDGHPSHPIRQVLRTGEPVLIQQITAADRETYGEADYLELLHALAFHSVLVAPLEARGRRFGAITLGMSDQNRNFDEDDIALGVEMAARAALAIDNARLFREVREARDDLARQFDFSDAVVRTIAEGILVVDRDGVMTYANPVAEQLLGCTSEQLVGQNAHASMHVRDAAGTPMPVRECRLQGVFAGGSTARLEREVFMRADGTTFPVSIVSSPLVRDGEVVGGVTVFRDISDEVRHQEELRASEERLQRALRSAGMVMWERDFVSGRTVRSEFAPRLYGRSKDELLDDSLNHLRLVHPDDHEHIASVVQQAVQNGTGYDVEYRVLWPDGTVRWLGGRASVFLDERGKPRGMSGTTHDITDRKVAELERHQLLAEREAEAEELRALHSQLKQSLEALLGIHDVGKLLISVSDPDAMAQRLLEIAVRAATLRAAVLRRSVPGAAPDVWRSVGEPDAIEAADRASAVAAAHTDPLAHLQSWSTRVPSAVSDQPDLTFWRIPLIVKDDVIGVLEGVGDTRLSDEPTMAILGSIALQAATAIENARLYREVADRERALHQLVQALMAAQEDERRRLAYEIHDGFAQLVSGLQQLLEAYAHELPRDPDDARHRIGIAVELARRTVQEIRRVLAGLRPTVLDDFGLARGLRSYVEGLRAEEFHVDYTESLGPMRLASDLEITLFRLAQEALANVRKHAGVQCATLRLMAVDREIVLEVQDSGRGFEPGIRPRTEQPGAQLGLLSMRERMAQVGGQLEITSRHGDGTLVRAVAPMAGPPGQRSVSQVGGQTDG